MSTGDGRVPGTLADSRRAGCLTGGAVSGPYLSERWGRRAWQKESLKRDTVGKVLDRPMGVPKVDWPFRGVPD